MTLLEVVQDQLAVTVAWFPFLLLVTIGTIGVLTMNVPFMMFTAGLIITLIGGTLAGKLVHIVINYLTGGRVPLWTPAPQCGILPPVLVPDLQSVSVFVPSAWLMAVAFLFTYIFLAGQQMLVAGGLPPWLTDGNHPDDLNNAQNTAITILFTSSIIALWIIIHRVFLTGCESPVPAILGIGVGCAAAYGWYKVAYVCPRWIADIFGITARWPPAAALPTAQVQCNAIPVSN